MRAACLVVVLAAFCSSGALGQRVNKCVDANGKTLYSADPCPSHTQASTLKIESASPAAVPPDAKKDAKGGKPASTPEAEFQKRRLAGEEADQNAAKERAEKQAAQENCARARGVLVELEAGRVARMDASGERRFLEDNQIAVERSKTQALVQQWCK